jgi:flagellar assembly factor FliW
LRANPVRVPDFTLLNHFGRFERRRLAGAKVTLQRNDGKASATGITDPGDSTAAIDPDHPRAWTFWPIICNRYTTRFMPEIATKYFGSVEYQPDAPIRFPAGLPGFEEEREFLALEPAASAPMVFLQSLKHPSLCFLALPMEVLASDYALATTREDRESLGLAPDLDPGADPGISCLAILVVTESGRISANLLAPILIHRGRRLGLQAIRSDSIYSHQHPVGEGVCS